MMEKVYQCPNTSNIIDPGPDAPPDPFVLNCPHCKGTHNTGQISPRLLEGGSPVIHTGQDKPDEPVDEFLFPSTPPTDDQPASSPPAPTAGGPPQGPPPEAQTVTKAETGNVDEVLGAPPQESPEA